MTWGVCTTAKAPLPQLLAFVAWHKHVGASRIWVHLDDADELSATVLNQIDGVTAILCDDAYWTVKGGRPHKQEPRQSYNMQRVYGDAELPIIAHVDVDEYLYSDRPIDDVLTAWDDDIFTARQFRLQFPNKMTSKKKMSVLGDYTPFLSQNMLSHKVGKSFFKTGLTEFIPKIHAGSFGADAPPPKRPRDHRYRRAALSRARQNRMVGRLAPPHGERGV